MLPPKRRASLIGTTALYLLGLLVPIRLRCRVIAQNGRGHGFSSTFQTQRTTQLSLTARLGQKPEVEVALSYRLGVRCRFAKLRAVGLFGRSDELLLRKTHRHAPKRFELRRDLLAVLLEHHRHIGKIEAFYRQPFSPSTNRAPTPLSAIASRLPIFHSLVRGSLISNEATTV